MTITRQELASWVSDEGGVADFILGYGGYSDRLPEGVPPEIVEAWERIEAVDPDVRKVSAWLWS